jgi:hypothetical protein
MLSLRIAAPAPAKEETTSPIAAAATGSAVHGAVQSSAGKSGRSSEVPAHRGVSAGEGMAGPENRRFSAQRVLRARLGAALDTGMSWSLS